MAALSICSGKGRYINVRACVCVCVCACVVWGLTCTCGKCLRGFGLLATTVGLTAIAAGAVVWLEALEAEPQTPKENRIVTCRHCKRTRCMRALWTGRRWWRPSQF